MRKVIYGGACSLDGFLAGPDSAVDWLHFSKDVEAIMAKTWAHLDTMLLGRKTWEFMVAASRAGGGPEAGAQAGPEGGAEAGPGASIPALKSYLFSRTLTEVPGNDLELVRRDAGEFVRELKEQPGKDMLVMSGGNLARSLFKAGVIDEIGLNIHPLLLGAGVPTFLDAGVRINLELTESRPLDGGCVMVVYRVKR